MWIITRRRRPVPAMNRKAMRESRSGVERPDRSKYGRPGVIPMWDGKNPPARVLLVEDAPFLRYAFGRLLRLHGFEVLEANDGLDALEHVNDFQPDLVVTDLMMPVMDGVELIRRLREDPRTAELPIL